MDIESKSIAGPLLEKGLEIFIRNSEHIHIEKREAEGTILVIRIVSANDPLVSMSEKKIAIKRVKPTYSTSKGSEQR